MDAEDRVFTAEAATELQCCMLTEDQFRIVIEPDFSGRTSQQLCGSPEQVF